MSDDLRRLSAWTKETDWPSPSCPECLSGQLGLAGAITSHEATNSARWHGHENWEPDMIYGWFSGVMQCNRRQCEEIVVITGDMKMAPEEEPDGSWHGQYENFFMLRQAIPALPLTGVLPPGVPKIVVERINQASAVLWTDPSAAANRLRLGVEDLLTELGVVRFNHKPRRRLSAGERLKRLEKTNKEVAQTLEAVKWIGNEGSHDDVLSVSEVLDGVDIMAHALELLYDKKRAELRRKVHEINANRGVPRKRVARRR